MYMEYGRKIIYFSGYEDEIKVRNAGYMAVFLKGKQCEVQMYYRATEKEEGGRIQPVYVFLDGTVMPGNEIFVEEGMAAASFRTMRQDFLQSGHSFEELETVYLDGIKDGICGGRVDGRGLKEFTAPESSCLEQTAVKRKETPAGPCLRPGGNRCCRCTPGFRNP